jgi:RNA polymerase sigma-54 factor
MPQLVQKLEPKLSQRPVLTPQLQQAIKLLQYTKLEITQEVAQALEENPALDDAQTTTEEGSQTSESDPREVETGDDAQRSDDDFDYESYFRDLEDSYHPPAGSSEPRSAEDMPTIEQVLSSQDHLADHLTWQLDMSDLSGEDREIGEAIIGNLDERGYLEASLEEIARMGPQQEPWDQRRVERVRRAIQRFDPIGVASLNLRDCLLVQLEMAGLSNSAAMQIVSDNLDLLERQAYDELEKRLSLTHEELDETLEIIRHLDPSPGEKYNPQPTTYISPDVYVIKDGDSYRVLVNDEGLPRLRVSPSYRRLLEGASASDASTRSYVREKIKAAFRLIRSLEERQRTIFKVATSIVKFQRAFLDRGIDQIRPLVLRDVAEDIGMHESTVSRVVNHKYMHTPRGVFEMRFFFHSGLGSNRADAVSSLTVKERIGRMIGDEDPNKPLSDQTIAETLRREGVDIARRTVAKYRKELKIASSTQRKRAR